MKVRELAQNTRKVVVGGVLIAGKAFETARTSTVGKRAVGLFGRVVEQRRSARRRQRDIIPPLARGVDWNTMPEWFKAAHRRETEKFAGERDLRQIGAALKRREWRILRLYRFTAELLSELESVMQDFDLPDVASPLTLEIDDHGRMWLICRDCPADAMVNAGFGAVADGVSLLMDMSRGVPVGVAMLLGDSTRYFPGKELSIRINLTPCVPSLD